jgi:hypothetical protein
MSLALRGLHYHFKQSFLWYVAARVWAVTLITQRYWQLKQVYDAIAAYIHVSGPGSWCETNGADIDNASLMAVEAWQQYILTQIDVRILICLTNFELTSF